MKFPDLYPKELKPYSAATSEEDLFLKLLPNKPDLLLFFETAAEDETWSERHPKFMTQVIEWLTEQNLNNLFPDEVSERVAKILREHYQVLSPFIPNDICLALKDQELNVNSLLMSTTSEVFKQLISSRSEKGQIVLDVRYHVFDPFYSYLKFGSVPHLSTWRVDEVQRLLDQATEWRVRGVSEASQNVLSKYIDKDNFIEILNQSVENRWDVYRDGSIEFVNRSGWGFKLFSTPSINLGFKFLDFSEPTLAQFERLKGKITGLSVEEGQMESLDLVKVVKALPALYMLDISGTLEYSEHLQYVSPNLKVLYLNQCPWVSQKSIKQLTQYFPDLKELSLQSNIQMSSLDFGALKGFTKLRRLDLSHCHQMNSTDLGVVVRVCSMVDHLILADCVNIDERGFVELAHQGSRFITLDLSKTKITDAGLIEILTRCRSLTTLKISRCLLVSDVGLKAVRSHLATTSTLRTIER